MTIVVQIEVKSVFSVNFLTLIVQFLITATKIGYFLYSYHLENFIMDWLQ